MVDSEGILSATMSLLISSRFALHFSIPDSLRKVQYNLTLLLALSKSCPHPSPPRLFRVTIKPPPEIRVQLLHVLYIVLSFFVVTWRSVLVLLLKR